MYSSYSPLQRTQLSGQVYTDTQSLYLLVYAPGRRVALENTLRDQLHRKFRLVDRLEGELTPSVNGVLLVSEDVECTSTALTYFAAALQQGADLVVCDAVFGYDGGSALYQTDQHLSGQRCALLSRALLDRCRAAARGKDDVLELLRRGCCKPSWRRPAAASRRHCCTSAGSCAPRTYSRPPANAPWC